MSDQTPGRAPSTASWLRIPIATALAIGLGGLVLVATAGVLAVTLWIARQNTLELLGDKARLISTGVVSGVDRFLEPARNQAEFIAGAIEAGPLEVSDRDRMATVLAASLASSTQLYAVAFIGVDRWMISAFRDEDGRIGTEVELLTEHPDGEAIYDALRLARGRGSAAYWGDPIASEGAGTLVNLRRPVYRDGAFIGLVVSTVALRNLSLFLEELTTEGGQTVFILHRRDFVLAHPALSQGFAGPDSSRPLPRLDEVGDPVLAAIWQPGWEEERFDTLNVEGHNGEVDDETYIYMYEKLPGFDLTPWLVGSYFATEDIGEQIRRLVLAGVFGLGAIAVAVVAALLAGRAFGRPVLDLAKAAISVRALDLDEVPTLGRSRLRELDEASSAFNAMAGGLRTFARYVPRTLVTRLIRTGDTVRSETRELTVMFTDIAGFTALAERMSAEETAALLNRHFAILTGCIEREGGTVDKFMGDAVMAFWNAPERQPDHAARAVRAAWAIMDAVRADNREQKAPLRVRIGIHTGPAVVGNIGAETRMNYTLVGDTVNAAQRLQELGKQLAPDAEVAVLLGEATAAALPDAAKLRPLGRHRLRGRDAPTSVMRLA